MPKRCLLALALVLAAATPAGAAEQFAGATRDGHLVLFRSDSPGALQGAATITGLAPGEHLVGLHVRPADGQLYGLGSGSRLYRLDVVTGAATLVNSAFFPALAGGRFGFSVDPNTDRFTVASDQGQLLRLDPNGQVLTASGVGAYAASDSGAALVPRVSAIAYSNNVRGAQATQLYGIDVARSALVQFQASSQTLTTIGPLGITARTPVGFDIAPDGTAWLALRVDGVPTLTQLDLQTGGAGLVAGEDRSRIARRMSSRATATDPVESIAVLGTAPDDKQAPRVVVDAAPTAPSAALLKTGVPLEVGCDEACTVAVTATVGVSTDAGTASAEIQATAGSRALHLRVAGTARATLRTRPSTALRLRIVATDAAGNTTTVRRSVTATSPLPSKP